MQTSYSSNQEGGNVKGKHYLAVAAIFKNESHCIREWVEHYINEGVDHFYLIDNGSTDDYKKEIASFLDAGLITLIWDDTRWAQVELYNKHFLPMKENTEWFLVCDLDEFIYSRNGYKTLSIFLRSLAQNVGVVRIPWKMFGSSGHIEQPKSIIQSFLKREAYKGGIASFIKGQATHSKAVVRSKFLKSLHLHFPFLVNNPHVVGPDGRKLPYPKSDFKKNFQSIGEKILTKSFVQLNHYALQSEKWFLEVKCTRGAADTEDHEHVRNLEYFKSYNENSNSTLDDELAKKTY